MTDEVRGFYDRYPCPRPVEDLDACRTQWQDLPRRRADFHLYWPSLPYRDDFSILIAGYRATPSRSSHVQPLRKTKVVRPL